MVNIPTEPGIPLLSERQEMILEGLRKNETTDLKIGFHDLYELKKKASRGSEYDVYQMNTLFWKNLVALIAKKNNLLHVTFPEDSAETSGRKCRAWGLLTAAHCEELCAALASHKGLVSFSISGNPIGTQGMAAIVKHIPWIKALNVEKCNLEHDERLFDGLNELVALKAGKQCLPDMAMRSIADLDNLRALSLRGHGNTLGALLHLTSKLSILDLSGNRLEDANLYTLSQMKHLSLLSIERSDKYGRNCNEPAREQAVERLALQDGIYNTPKVEAAIDDIFKHGTMAEAQGPWGQRLRNMSSSITDLATGARADLKSGGWVDTTERSDSGPALP